MGKVTEINETDFEKTVLKAKLPVLVDFWAPWCRPCMMTAPFIEDLSVELTGKMNFTKINVDNNRQVAVKYGVMSIPNMIVFKDGKVAAQIVGYRSKADIKKTLDEVIE